MVPRSAIGEGASAAPTTDATRPAVSVIVTCIEGVSLKGRPGKPWAHAKGCDCTVTQTFTCDRCGRRFGWCLGCHDKMPGVCDFCWREVAP